MVFGVIGTPCSRSAMPYPLEKTGAPSFATPTAQPGVVVLNVENRASISPRGGCPLALLWYFWLGGVREEPITVGASQRRRLGEDVEDSLPDGRHARLRWRSEDSFFSVPLR